MFNYTLESNFRRSVTLTLLNLHFTPIYKQDGSKLFFNSKAYKRIGSTVVEKPFVFKEYQSF